MTRGMKIFGVVSLVMVLASAGLFDIFGGESAMAKTLGMLGGTGLTITIVYAIIQGARGIVGEKEEDE